MDRNQSGRQAAVVRANVAYIMQCNGLDNSARQAQVIGVTVPTWLARMRTPDRFSVGELTAIARFGRVPVEWLFVDHRREEG